MAALVLTSTQMRAAEKYTIEGMGVSSLLLMERAGRALAKECVRLAPAGDILCVCGGGNNGGDGFVCARLLKAKGRAVDVVCLAKKFSPDCTVNMEKWTGAGGICFTEIPEKKYALVVDCLFGTGFHGSLENENKSVVEQINALKEEGAKVLSADIPSGVDGENGWVDGVAVRADVTLWIGEVKTGVLFNDGIDYAGEVKRAEIGVALSEAGYACWTDKVLVKSLLPARKRNSHKGTYGKAAIVAGSIEYTGAAYLSAAACIRAGAGYTTLFLPKKLLPFYALKAPEILLKGISGGDRYVFNSKKMEELLIYDSIAFGMGMGVSEEVFKGASYLLKNYTGKLLLDADALNSIAYFSWGKLDKLFAKKKCDVILSPHIKEFSRLSSWTAEEILKDSLSLAQRFSKEYGVTLLLKNACTIITNGERTALNTTGNSGQAKGGSGDVLAGVIAGLCAGGLSAYDGGVVGAYLVGKSAEIALPDVGEYSMTASELIAYLPKTFLFVTENTDENGGEQ